MFSSNNHAKVSQMDDFVPWIEHCVALFFTNSFYPFSFFSHSCLLFPGNVGGRNCCRPYREQAANSEFHKTLCTGLSLPTYSARHRAELRAAVLPTAKLFSTSNSNQNIICCGIYSNASSSLSYLRSWKEYRCYTSYKVLFSADITTFSPAYQLA